MFTQKDIAYSLDDDFSNEETFELFHSLTHDVFNLTETVMNQLQHYHSEDGENIIFELDKYTVILDKTYANDEGCFEEEGQNWIMTSAVLPIAHECVLIVNFVDEEFTFFKNFGDEETEISAFAPLENFDYFMLICRHFEEEAAFVKEHADSLQNNNFYCDLLTETLRAVESYEEYN